jgi:hypothetical protein
MAMVKKRKGRPAKKKENVLVESQQDLDSVLA